MLYLDSESSDPAYRAVKGFADQNLGGAPPAVVDHMPDPSNPKKTNKDLIRIAIPVGSHGTFPSPVQITINKADHFDRKHPERLGLPGISVYGIDNPGVVANLKFEDGGWSGTVYSPYPQVAVTWSQKDKITTIWNGKKASSVSKGSDVPAFADLQSAVINLAYGLMMIPDYHIAGKEQLMKVVKGIYEAQQKAYPGLQQPPQPKPPNAPPTKHYRPAYTPQLKTS
jgi:hypothetical protein